VPALIHTSATRRSQESPAITSLCLNTDSWPAAEISSRSIPLRRDRLGCACVLAISTAKRHHRVARLPQQKNQRQAKVECCSNSQARVRPAMQIFLARQQIAALHRKCLPDQPKCCEPLPANSVRKLTKTPRRPAPFIRQDERPARFLSGPAPGKAASSIDIETCASGRGLFRFAQAKMISASRKPLPRRSLPRAYRSRKLRSGGSACRNRPQRG